MSEQDSNLDPHFLQLVLSMQAGAMQQMGKIASQLSGKVERDLPMAKFSIDILGMLETKTKGNLSEEEERMLTHVLYELRMNYVDESTKGDEDETSDKDESNQDAEKSPADEPPASEDSDESTKDTGGEK